MITIASLAAATILVSATPVQDVRDSFRKLGNWKLTQSDWDRLSEEHPKLKIHLEEAAKTFAVVYRPECESGSSLPPSFRKKYDHFVEELWLAHQLAKTKLGAKDVTMRLSQAIRWAVRLRKTTNFRAVNTDCELVRSTEFTKGLASVAHVLIMAFNSAGKL